MKNKDLIELLQRVDPDTDIYVHGVTNGIRPILGRLQTEMVAYEKEDGIMDTKFVWLLR